MEFRRRALCSAAALLTVVVSYATAFAQDGISLGYLQPTRAEDCALENLPSYYPKQNARDAVSTCLRRADVSGKWMWIEVCEYPGSITCAAIEAKRCVLEDALREEARLCRERLSEYLDREQSELAREREDRAQALRDDAARERAARAATAEAIHAGKPDVAAMIMRNYIDPKDPTVAAGSLVSEGTRLGGRFGFGQSSAMRLSSQISKQSLAHLRDIQQDVLGSFDAAVTEVVGADDVAAGGSRPSDLNPKSPPAGFVEIGSKWGELSDLGKAAAIGALVFHVVGILNENPVAEHPSLIDGTFALNVTRIADAVAGGGVLLSTGNDPFEMETRVIDLIAEVERIETRKALAWEEEQGRMEHDYELAEQHDRERLAREAEEERRLLIAIAEREAEEEAARIRAMREGIRQLAEAERLAELQAQEERSRRSKLFFDSLGEFSRGMLQIYGSGQPSGGGFTSGGGFKEYDDGCPGPSCEIGYD